MFTHDLSRWRNGRCFRLWTLWVGAFLVAPALAAPIELVKVEPTPLFPRREELSQLVYLTIVNNTEAPTPLHAIVSLAGMNDQTTDLGSVPVGESTQSVLVPDHDAPAKLTIELLGAGDAVLAKWEGTHEPQRKWIVFIVKSSHEDLGYEDYIFKKQEQIADNIDLARKLSGPQDSPVGAAKPTTRAYHYQLESLIFERNYIDERSESAWRDIVEKDIKPGRMSLIGVPNGAHTHWMDYEELARFMYAGRREMRDRFGLDLKTFQIVDNPSVSWSACQAAVDAGYKYVCRFGQPWRTGGNNDYKTTKLPAIFWWMAPDGVHKALFSWRNHYGLSFWYGQPGGGDADPSTMDPGAHNVIRELRSVESGEELGPYPYDALLIPSYSDHETPAFDSRALNRWQTAYRYPEIRIAPTQDFFEYIEKKFGDKLPTLSGDLNNFSGDYSTIDPEGQAWKRRAARILPAAESLATIAGAMDSSYLPAEQKIDRTFAQMFDYDEHSWPTSPAALDVHLFNAQWVKHNEADRVLKASQALFEGASSELFKHVPTSGKACVIVFNPLAHERTDLVEVGARIDSLIDPNTHQAVTSQNIGNDRTIFVAANIPAFGYKVYPLASDAVQQQSSLTATEDSLENEFFKIRFDIKTGTVASIFDKQLKQEWIDSSAAQKFNQLVLVEAKNRTSPEIALYSPSKVRAMHSAAGAVQAEMISDIDDAKTGAAITQHVKIYAGIKRIDVVNDLRHVKALYTERREDRYRENIYYAFPIKVDNFQARAEYAGGVVRPFTDQLRWGSHDYLMANRWVDVSNSDFGVTMAPWNAPAISFGEIRYNQLSVDYKPTSSHLFSDAWSNRMAGIVDLCPDDVNATFGYSFTSHEENWNSGKTTPFGWTVASPLEARVLPAGQTGELPATQDSFASVDAPNVQLTALKPSTEPGRGWVIRLVETEGKATDVTLALPGLPINSAVSCNLVEDDEKPLEVSEKKIHLSIGAFAFATIRVLANEPAPAAITAVHADALSDSGVKLSWTASTTSSVVYNIFRSEDPDAPPTAYTLVARSTKPEFIDTGLSIDTTYYYRVAPVTSRNTQGSPSGMATMRTRSENTTAPLPVDGLGIVRRSTNGLTVYWRKSPEPDVARYLVFRGDRPDFDLANIAPIAVVRTTPAFLQTYRDDGLNAGTTYYYKVIAEDWAGLKQTESPVTSATTPKE